MRMECETSDTCRQYHRTAPSPRGLNIDIKYEVATGGSEGGEVHILSKLAR